ncbi:MAG: glycosyl hydrolase family 95 catalytic domain-containing protein [Lachnospiraceae bacterium]
MIGRKYAGCCLCTAIKKLFCAHPPFQIDGNLGYTAAIVEMLMQSDEDKIVLLPAIPDKWQKGRVKGLKAKWLKIVGGEKSRLSVVYNRKEEQVSFDDQKVYTPYPKPID